MKLIATVLLFASLPPAHVTPPISNPQIVTARKESHRGGIWYMTEDGHAILCYGPTMYVQTGNGGLARVATFCRGDKTIVRLHE